MSKENAKKFQQALDSDSSLKSKFDDLMESIGKLSEKELKQKIVDFAHKEGYDIEESDFKDNVFSGDSGELSDDELLNVAGGSWCWSTFSCAMFSRHLEKNQTAKVNKDGSYMIETKYESGGIGQTYYDANGKEIGYASGVQSNR